MNALLNTVKKIALPLLLFLVAIMSLLLFYLSSQQISALNRQVNHQFSQIDNNAEQEKFTLINSEIIAIKQQVNRLDNHLAKIQKSLTEHNNQLLQIDERVTVESIKNQESYQQLKSLNHSAIESVKKALDKLMQRLNSVTEAKQQAVVTPTRTPTTKPAAVPPFTLIGIEQRGGLAFAAILPHQANNLAEIRLVEIGQTVQGWKLLSIGDGQARFSHAGQTRTLTL